MDAEAGDYLAKAFRDVDVGATEKLARCLEYLDCLPEFRRYKSTIVEWMNPQPGSVVADLGCGLGFDVHRLAALVEPTGRAIGVDASLKFLASARAANAGVAAVEFLQADIRKLPFANGLLQACKVDRTLQHVEEPQLVVQEMFRTLCPGGMAVCAEPDWGTFSIDFPWREGEQDIALQVISLWTKGFQNPRIGCELRRLLDQAGFVDLRAQEFLLTTANFDSSDTVFDLAESTLRLSKMIASDAPLAWLSRLRECSDKVCCSVTLTVHVAKKP